MSWTFVVVSIIVLLFLASAVWLVFQLYGSEDRHR